MVDLAITGHLESSAYMGAIAVGSMVFNIIYWTFSFLRMGVTGLTAQAYGAKNNNEVINNFSRGLIVAIVGSLLLIILQIPIERLVFMLVDGSNEVEIFAKEYFYIRIWAAPATISMYVVSGWFIGMQNTKIPMVIALLVNVFNIGFNLLFVNVLGMKSDGVALGTVIAQYLGLIVAIVFFLLKYKSYFKFFSLQMALKRDQLLHFFKVNKDIFIRTMSLLAVFTFFTSQSASTNDSVLAANTLLLQFLFIFSFLTDGFAYAAEALTGKYFGRKDMMQLKTAIKLSFNWGALLALLFTFIYLFGSNPLIKLLTNQQEVIQQSQNYKIWVVLIPCASIVSFIWDGVFIGITAAKQMRNSMLVAAFIVFFPVWFLLYESFQNHALWFAFILFLFTRGFAQTIIYFKTIRPQLFINKT